MTETPPEPRRLGAANAQLLSWAALGLVNVFIIALYVPFTRERIVQRAAHHFYDAGQMLALGMASAAVVGLYNRVAPRAGPGASRARAFLLGPFLDVAAAAAVALSLAYPILADDLANLAVRLRGGDDEGSSKALHLILIAVVALGIPIATTVGKLFNRNWLRPLACLGSLGVGVVNERILIHDYPGAHFYLAWAAAACGGAALADLPIPPASRALSRASVGLQAAVALCASYSIVVWPRAGVVLQLYEVPGSVAAPFLARVHQEWGGNRSTALVSPEWKPWFESRAHLPDIPPSAPAPSNRIVLMLFADSLRSDLFTSNVNTGFYPELNAFKKRSVYFREARSPGSQTVYSFTAIFAAKYYSQMYWTERAPGGLWAHEDPSPRFPELLSKAGIPTVTFATKPWLVNEYGVVRGFQEETVVDPELAQLYSPPAKDVADAVIARLMRQGDGPLFLFAHFLDTHFPYGKTEGAPFPRYLFEVGNVGKEIGRILAAVDLKGFTDRTTVMIGADHGEAFGEHGTTQHSVSLYEELVHVPLLIRTPGAPSRGVSTQVSLLDIGPTVLDLFGVPTPATYMGQSLAPFLRGESPALARPILAEGRMKKMLLFPDGLKVIRDPRLSTIEVYDLNKDPREEVNLYDDLAEAGDARVGALQAFFDAHTLRRVGYEPPYRP